MADMRCTQRSIPAWAGEPTSIRGSSNRGKVYPRVGGGTQSDVSGGDCSVGLSPRGRGNPSYAKSAESVSGSIPAWAGEPPELPSTQRTIAVYPRVGGGTKMPDGSIKSQVGLSPRGRGNPYALRHDHIRTGSIPAWAGEPVPSATGLTDSAVYPRVGGGT